MATARHEKERRGPCNWRNVGLGSLVLATYFAPAAYFARLERRLFRGGRKPPVEIVEDCLDGRAQLVF